MLSVFSLPFCFIFTKKKCSGCRAILASYVYFFIQLCLDLVYFHLWLISIMFSYVCGLRHQSFRFACDIRRPSPHPFSQDAFFTLTQYPLATGCPSYPQSLSRYLVFSWTIALSDLIDRLVAIFWMLFSQVYLVPGIVFFFVRCGHLAQLIQLIIIISSATSVQPALISSFIM